MVVFISFTTMCSPQVTHGLTTCWPQVVHALRRVVGLKLDFCVGRDLLSDVRYIGWLIGEFVLVEIRYKEIKVF